MISTSSNGEYKTVLEVWNMRYMKRENIWGKKVLLQPVNKTLVCMLSTWVVEYMLNSVFEWLNLQEHCCQATGKNMDVIEDNCWFLYFHVSLYVREWRQITCLAFAAYKSVSVLHNLWIATQRLPYKSELKPKGKLVGSMSTIHVCMSKCRI